MLEGQFVLGFSDQGRYVERGAILEALARFELDARKRALTGLGHLPKSDDKVVQLPQDQSAQSQTGDSLALGGT